MNVEASPPQPLVQAVGRVLAAVSDRALAARLEIVFSAADACVARLRAIDLSGFEIEDEEGADLGMWNQLAPTIGQTLGYVNELGATVREHFPEGQDTWPEGSREARCAALVRRHAVSLTGLMADFGKGVRNPEIVGSRWALLAHLQGAIGRFNALVGDLVHESASCFMEISRSEVVPHHVALVKESVALRRAMVDLARVAGMYLQKLKLVKQEEAPALLTQLESDLGQFAKTSAHRSLWAQDKRELLQHRALLRSLATQGAGLDAVRQEVSAFHAFVVRLGAVNGRALLVEHDRELAALCAMRLQDADTAQATQPARAAKLVTEVLRDSWSLYGREPEFDAFLRKVKKRGPVTFTAAQLKEEIETLARMVGRIPLALLGDEE